MYDIFKHYGLDKIRDSYTGDKKLITENWEEVASKSVHDSDGFTTDYTWYTDGDKHIFMFGDKDVYEPDEDYADWVCETEQQAQDWFDTYTGFESDEILDSDLEMYDEDLSNPDFMNSGFDRVYGIEEDISRFGGRIVHPDVSTSMKDTKNLSIADLRNR